MRIFKLAQSWSTMNMLLRTIGNSVGQLGNLTLVLGIIVYMLAVVGMQLFGNVYTLEKFGDDPIPRWNFDNFGNSFMMIFRVLCGEWIEPLYDCMRATNPLAILFFFTTLIIGNFMVSSLYTVLIMRYLLRRGWRSGKISASQPEGPRFNPRPLRGLTIFFPAKVHSAFHPSEVGKWVPAYMDRIKAATRCAYARCAYMCFRSAGGKLIIVLRLGAYSYGKCAI